MTDPRYVASGMSAAREIEFYAIGAVEVKAWEQALARNGRSLTGTASWNRVAGWAGLANISRRSWGNMSASM